jgi:hypothetical protein
MKEHLGKFAAEGFAFAKEALDAAGIEYAVRDDNPGSRYSIADGRMAATPPMFDVLVDGERLADAKIAVARWQEEAEDAARRESGAPPPTAEDLAADAEWEKQKAAAATKRSSPVWPGLLLIAVVGGLLALVLLGRH